MFTKNDRDAFCTPIVFIKAVLRKKYIDSVLTFC